MPSSLPGRLQAFLDMAPGAILVIDGSGKIVAGNDRAAAMLDRTMAEISNQSIGDQVPEYQAGGAPQIQIGITPTQTPHGTIVVAAIHGATDRQAEERFRGLLESAPDGIVVVDSTGTIVIINSQTERMFGYSRRELVGQHIELLVPDRFRPKHVHDRDAYAADPRTRPMGAGRPLTGRKRDGTEFPVEISLSPLATEQGVLVMSIVRDITDRRRAEEQIQASLREKEALLREIHHRVKNNLQVTSSLLRLQAGTIEDPQTREVFAGTQDRIRSMALVHEKLYQSTNLSRIDFAEYIGALADLLFKSYAVNSSLIKFAVEGEQVFLNIDTAVPCGLIVNEILSNALKHAFPDGRSGEIVVRLQQTNGSCVMTIRDSGIGLKPESESAPVRTLGLQLVRGLVQQIEGAVEVGRDGGTVFTITFPISRTAHG
jgi:PAS domain S-box-containing protein